MISQREQLEATLAELRPQLLLLEPLVCNAYEILGKASNAPPLGEADGSISEYVWVTYQPHVDNLLGALRALIHTEERSR